MMARHWSHAMVWLAVWALTLAVFGGRPVAAGDLDKLNVSLKWIPEDAAFYSTMLRNREQFEAIRQSNAWAKVRQMPAVEMLMAMYQAQTGVQGSGPSRLNEILSNPESRKVVDLLGDMVSDEAFVYGDETCIDFVELFQAVNAAQSYGPSVLQASGLAAGRDPSQLQAMMVLSTLAKHADLIAVPNFLVGFKVKNTELAKEQLIKLEMFANVFFESNKKTKGHFKKTKIGDYDYLTLTLDGSMIPWEQGVAGRLQSLEMKAGETQKVVERVKAAKLAVALGLRGDYLVCSIGSSFECLEKLGQGKRLADLPELRPLEAFASKRLTSISYVSEELNQQLNSNLSNVNAMLEIVDQMLPKANLSEEQDRRVRKDIDALVDDLKKMTPEVGAGLAWSFLCDRGLESYQYQWGDHRRLDGSKPLGLCEHVGGKPLLGVVSRAKFDIAPYDKMVGWLKVGYTYFEEFGLPAVPNKKDRDLIKNLLKETMPLLARLDKANREMLFPALDDGQLAFVVDGQLSSKRFHVTMPATEKPMPMAEPALVLGVSDAKLLKQAMDEYRAVVEDAIDVVRGIPGAEVPKDFKLPEAQKTQVAGGEVYCFALPKECGLDEQIVPTFGLSDHVAVVAISRPHAERLLKATPLAVGGVLEKGDRPRAVAGWLEIGELATTAAPWIDFAIDQNKETPAAQKESTQQQVRTGVEVLQAAPSFTSESYLKDDAMVTHSLLELHDIAK
ncbi:MAG: hypothetical protein LLF97_04625 [Planctomycetaceae bacterium]|nr:hypothetical protein [Planctomycetaceae bacterium]